MFQFFSENRAFIAAVLVIILMGVYVLTMMYEDLHNRPKLAKFLVGFCITVAVIATILVLLLFIA